MIRFRGHHLICLHFFQGEGYNREFVDNLKGLVDRAGRGEEIEVVEGPDDVCRACPYLSGNRCAHKEGADQEIRQLDGKALSFLKISAGQRVNWLKLKEKIKSAPEHWFSSFCRGCDWESVCDRVR
ncbi:DUF1284 domain-containing protein [Thermosediminibacter oceani]|uniref:Iron-sulfur binding protein n=1 Tax=Thermosediminibacter oceani (strain ATCC BAA-1034 / DSM 16646 / JW/IW-1228P) TaxID=555079 RepID=D9RY18_THEOJ|nr:DUF1284 domain-containing protein [Thermosediminibacter oceani]ADL08242.1 protein of unknown function DUF1284 [Thermosediminibacter oceani DSM 16646]